MKKFFALALSLVMALSLAACGDTSDKDKKDDSNGKGDSAAVETVEDGKLIMSTNGQFPPYEMVADNGELEGIDIEVAGLIAEKLGLELIVDDMDFDAALMAVQNGKSDMVMAGVTVNPSREKVMDFTNTYANGVQVVIVREGSDVTLDNMGEKMIGVQRGTTGHVYCSDTVENGGFGEDHVTPYDDGAVAVQALVNGQVDCVVIDNAPAQSYVEANEGLTILDTEFANEEYAIGVAKGNTELQTAINDALKELEASGDLQKIVDKYIPAE